MLSDECGINEDENEDEVIGLFFDGKRLEDSKTLSDYNIHKTTWCAC